MSIFITKNIQTNNMKKEVRIKEPVRIRTKRLSNGCESIYLDIYMDGRRRYEFLKLFKSEHHETGQCSEGTKDYRIAEWSIRL